MCIRKRGQTGPVLHNLPSNLRILSFVRARSASLKSLLYAIAETTVEWAGSTIFVCVFFVSSLAISCVVAPTLMECTILRRLYHPFFSSYRCSHFSVIALASTIYYFRHHEFDSIPP